jgi:hypothetical protein
MSRKVTLSTAIRDVVKHRTLSLYSRVMPPPEVRKSTRAYTDVGKETAEIDDKLSKMALNMFLKVEHRLETRLFHNMITEVVTIKENIPGFIKNKIKSSAAGHSSVSLSASGIENMMRNRLLTRTSFTVGEGIYRLHYPESLNKFAIVSRKDIKYNLWTHYVYGADTSFEQMKDWNNRDIKPSECIFVVPEDSSFIMMSDSSPMLYAAVGSSVVPLFFVPHKNYSSMEELQEDFGKFDAVYEKNVSIDMGFKTDEIVESVMSNVEVDDSDICKFLLAVPKRDTIEKCLRVVGQNMLTAYKMKFEGTEVSDSDFMDFADVLDDINLEDDPDTDYSMLIMPTETTRVTFERASNSLILTLASFIKRTKDMEKVWLTEQLLKRFSQKTVLCSLILIHYVT